MTAEQLEAARSERMRQNGHGAITIEDVRTWIEETGLAIFLPRSAQAGFTAPTFVEAVAGERTTEPTLELIATAEELLVRLEAEGVAVRLNLAGQPGDQPDYVVAGWVLPYIYALRGDRDWRRSPQLTGSRQVSPLAVQAAKHLDSANLTALQLRDALGRETSETAVLRALHELWKQLRVIPVVPEVGKPAAWQPLRQRFQKAIAEGASTSQVTAISVLASIYLQAVIAASMEDVELFLAPLTSRSKIREVVRGLAATRQVHSTTAGHTPMYYVAGTLPDFPAAPSYQAGALQPSYRSSSYRTPTYTPPYADEFLDGGHEATASEVQHDQSAAEEEVEPILEIAATAEPPARLTIVESEEPADRVSARPSVPNPAAKPAAHAVPHRPRPSRTANSTHPRDRNRAGATSGDDRRRATGQRKGASHSSAARSNGARPAGPSKERPSFSNGNGHSATNGHNGNGHSSNGHNANGNGNGNGHSANGQGHPKPAGEAKNGNGTHASGHKAAKPAWGGKSGGGSQASARPSSSRPAAPRAEARSDNRSKSHPGSANGHGTPAGKPGNGARPNGSRPAPARPTAKATGKPAPKSAAGLETRPAARPASRTRPAEAGKRKPASVSASKRYSFAGQAKQAPKAAGKRGAAAAKPVSRPAAASKRRG